LKNKTIIITPIPAFYKVNLYNKIAEQKNIEVWFISQNSNETRSNDFITNNFKFNYWFINPGNFQNRKKLFSCIEIFKKLNNQKPAETILCGWDFIEFWIIRFFFKKYNLSFILESSVYESTTKGFKGFLKRFFLKYISKVYASGTPQVELLEKLNYNNIIKVTKGVGIINYNQKIKPLKDYQKKFIYVGRLSPEKNIEFLIKVFNQLIDFELFIIGEGPLEKNLKEISNENIKFLGKHENKHVPTFFSKSNFLILPSISETWGLVVEEAFYCGLPVILSSNCGSMEFIKVNQNGYIFNSNNSDSLLRILQSITNLKYQNILNCMTIDFIEKKDKLQVESYL